MTSSLRVASWNVREAKPVDNGSSAPIARTEIAHLLNYWKVDIAALQEVGFADSGNSEILQVIQDETELSHSARSVLSESSFDPGRYAGLAIVSRFPLKDVEEIQFANPSLSTTVDGQTIYSHDKGLVSATVASPQLEISMLSLHCVPFKMFGHDAVHPRFTKMWAEISAALQGFAARSAIICGDFNTDRRDLASSPNGRTLFSAMADQPTQSDDAVDDILFTSEFRLTSAWVIDNFSDHRLCVAELTVDGHQERVSQSM